MPVLVEAFSVIVRRLAIDARYPGGFAAFERDAPYLGGVPDTFCADDDLARVGFMMGTDLHRYLARLRRHGLAEPNMAVISASIGPLTCCDWLERLTYAVDGGIVQAARLVGSTSHELVLPFEWSWESSLTRNTALAPDSVLDAAEIEGRIDGVDIYRDRVTGQERFVGRAWIRTAEDRQLRL